MTTNKTIQEILHEHYRDEGSHTPESQICETCVAELNQLMLQERIKSGISELENLDHNPQMFGDWQQVVEDRINELEAQLEKSKP